jgi:hypothetical protein
MSDRYNRSGEITVCETCNAFGCIYPLILYSSGISKSVEDSEKTRGIWSELWSGILGSKSNKEGDLHSVFFK